MYYKDIKACVTCEVTQVVCSDPSVSDFYKRSGIAEPTDLGHFNSECKTCMKGRNIGREPISPLVPRTATEVRALDYLREHHIPAIPGKALRAAHVDVVAWGCVQLEVKFARIQLIRGRRLFVFVTTPSQSKNGFRAHVTMLICEYADNQRTFHLFDAADPVFQIHGRTKTGFDWLPGRLVAAKHDNNRVVMVDAMMDGALDRLELIEAARLRIAEAL